MLEGRHARLVVVVPRPVEECCGLWALGAVGCACLNGPEGCCSKGGCLVGVACCKGGSFLMVSQQAGRQAAWQYGRSTARQHGSRRVRMGQVGEQQLAVRCVQACWLPQPSQRCTPPAAGDASCRNACSTAMLNSRRPYGMHAVAVLQECFQHYLCQGPVGVDDICRDLQGHAGHGVLREAGDSSTVCWGLLQAA